jgi:hypothetical protein
VRNTAASTTLELGHCIFNLSHTSPYKSDKLKAFPLYVKKTFSSIPHHFQLSNGRKKVGWGEYIGFELHFHGTLSRGIYLAHALDHCGLGQIGTTFAFFTLHTCEKAHMQEPESNLSVISRIPYWLYAWLCTTPVPVMLRPCRSFYVPSPNHITLYVYRVESGVGLILSR